MIHIWRPCILSNFQDPHPPCPSTSKSLPSPWRWTSNFKRIYNYSHFLYSFCNQPVLFAQLENVNELCNNNGIMPVNERFKNKNKSCHIQIDDLAHKKCSGVMKGWRHCLTSESKGRFLVSNHSSNHPPPTPHPRCHFSKKGSGF